MILDLNKTYRFDSITYEGVGKVIGYKNSKHIAKVQDIDNKKIYNCVDSDVVEYKVLYDIIEQLNNNAKYIAIPIWCYKELKDIIIDIINSKSPDYLRVEIPRKRLEQYLINYIVIALKDERYSDNLKKRKTDGYAKHTLLRNEKLKCCFCLGNLTVENVTAEHIIPYSQCHNNSTANLCLSCTDCNQERGVQDFYKFLTFKRSEQLKKLYPNLNIKRYIEII